MLTRIVNRCFASIKTEAPEVSRNLKNFNVQTNKPKFTSISPPVQSQINNHPLTRKPRVPANIYPPEQPLGISEIKVQKFQLTPHQLYLLETKSMERPFTGHLWAEKDMGHYHCAVCKSRLFSFDHKFFPATGMASFWGHVGNKVKIVDEQVRNLELDANYSRHANKDARHRRAECTHCSSHLGVVFFDGPPPTGLRYSINSAALVFEKVKDFPDPNIKRKQIRKEQEQKKFVPIP